MTKIPKGPTPATAASLPFTPTADKNGDPTVCWCCGFRADGLGIATARLKEKAATEKNYICVKCAVVVGRIRAADRLDQFEIRALDGGVDAVGEYLETIGIYDLTLMDELNRRMIVKAAWFGCAEALRNELESHNAPF
jgi:hypothetical protein